MEITKTIVIRRIAEHCMELGLKFIDNYLDCNEDNLLYQYANWDLISSEISEGGGGELRGNKSKFKAIFSSSALCVNNFAPINQFISDYTFLGDTNFTYSRFEKGLPTGISTPYLDFYIENKNTIYAFESKFTEVLDAKLPNSINRKGETVGNLQKYVNRRNSLKLQIGRAHV